jgi:2-polyprenyl-3-methyl-5-hydroxy-6-metoxy-1,4-benzoquinol methylase
MTKQNNSERLETACPLCRSASPTISHFGTSFIKDELSSHFETQEGLDQVEINDYAMHRCPSCELEFADPMKPGSSSFYEWVCHQPAYYPEERWEYLEYDDWIEKVIGTKGKCRVMDVGCGSGKFLRRLKLKYAESIHCVGVDITEGALSQADEGKIEFLLGDHRTLDTSTQEPFDLVTSFHCLEHVEDPLGFALGMKKFAAVDGKIAISTPLSPMSFEYGWVAIMNCPPHHMSRWSEKSYRALSEKLGMKLQLRSDVPAGPFGRTSNSVNRAVHGTRQPSSRLARYVTLIRHPATTISHFIHQLNRPKLNGKTQGEDILAILSH